MSEERLTRRSELLLQHLKQQCRSTHLSHRFNILVNVLVNISELAEELEEVFSHYEVDLFMTIPAAQINNGSQIP